MMTDRERKWWRRLLHGRVIVSSEYVVALEKVADAAKGTMRAAKSCDIWANHRYLSAQREMVEAVKSLEAMQGESSGEIEAVRGR